MSLNARQDFLVKLQAEAAQQALLEKKRFFPSSLDFVTSYIGRYSWQILVVLSGASALGVEIWQWLA